jgi:intracellular sulfur oxidation DsrE/DsrF family protein
MQIAGDGSKGTRRHAAQVRDRRRHRIPMERPMHRRNILMGTFTVAGALIAAAAKGARANAAEADKPKVVYHLCDLDKVGFVLGNIKNHFEGMGGPDKVTIELVVHGPALKAFHAASANADVARRLGDFSNAGLTAQACGNTMRTQNVTLKDLLPGFGIAERGGVVRIAELQSLGYAYLRP